MSTLTGKTLGKYRLVERIGRGGMADVYRAPHPRLGRDVAIKTLHPHLTEGQGLLVRFEREGQAIARMRHPHIVQIYDFDVEDEIVYMVMEYLEGGSLKSRLLELQERREYLPLGEVARLVDEIGQALDFAHSSGILHRDVKPANVLLDREGKAYLTDFGIVRVLSETQFTATGSLIGTPAYMSPEQGKGEPLTPASDIYSLGVILYEMLTNRVPFDADTPLAVIHKQIYEALPSPRTVRPDLPPGVERVAKKALAKDPADRYPTAAAMVRDLRQALQAMETDLEKSPVPSAGIAEKPERPGGAQPPSVGLPEAAAKELTSADFKPTVAMAEPSEEDFKPTVDMEPIAPMEEPPPAPSAAGRAAPDHAVRKTRRKVLPLVVGGIVLVAAVAGIALSGVLQPEGAKTCSELLECRNMAAEALANGDSESAVVYLDSVLNQPEDAAHPLGADLWCMRGQANQALGRVPDAIRDYEQCMERSQGNPGMADLRKAAETALLELRGDIGPRCENPDRCAAEADRLIAEGRFEEAIAVLDRGLGMVPENVHPPNAHLWCLRGDAHREIRAKEEAIRSYETCIGWTEGDLDLEPLRREAERNLRQLRGD